MAKIDVIAGSIANTVVLTSNANGPGKNNGLLYRKNPKQTLVIQRSNNNKNSTSQPFQQTDQTIINLDARYEKILFQSQWELYATTISGLWENCSNCTQDTGGKKLYRQFNLFRLLRGLAITDTVPFTASVSPQKVASMSYETIASNPGLSIVEVAMESAFGDCWVTVNAGQGMMNPTFFLPATDQNVELFSGATWTAVISIITRFLQPPALPGTTFGNQQVCTFLEDGSPGQSNLNGNTLIWISNA